MEEQEVDDPYSLSSTFDKLQVPYSGRHDPPGFHRVSYFHPHGNLEWHLSMDKRQTEVFKKYPRNKHHCCKMYYSRQHSTLNWSWQILSFNFAWKGLACHILGFILWCISVLSYVKVLRIHWTRIVRRMWTIETKLNNCLRKSLINFRCMASKIHTLHFIEQRIAE